MKQVYGYIRVSTKEQVAGASLPEQKNAIMEFAKKNQLKIIHFYEESKTAAKRGRPYFVEMIKNLKDGKAVGVIMHKIDRSARNLHDWASVGDLIDNGIEVFFAHESLNMNERGGRLSADIQAVMASDYVRNLKQEITKGLYGRLKQGLYPWGAPIGYLNNGRGKLKTIDLIQSEYIKMTFELYRTGNYNLIELSKRMEKIGLKNKRGKRVCKNGISRILRNPFYMGIIKIKDRHFKGNHESLISARLFKQTQMIMNDNHKGKVLKHNYLFRKLIRCHNCNYIMSGELQKGHVYYRCKTKKCNTKCIREDILEKFFQNIVRAISLTGSEAKTLKLIINKEKEQSIKIQSETLNAFNLKLIQLKNKESKLLDAYLENVLDKDTYKAKHEINLFEQQELEEQKTKIELSKDSIFNETLKIVELCKNLFITYNSAIQEEKREWLEIICPNLTIDLRKALFSTTSPFYELAHRDVRLLCDDNQDTKRIKYGTIIYSDKNTSPVIPKPLKGAKLKNFYNYLKSVAPTLQMPSNTDYQYEIPKNDPDTQ